MDVIEEGVEVYSFPGLITLSPEHQAILTYLVADEHVRPLIVGGSVRDELLGRPAHDLDIEIYGPVEHLELIAIGLHEEGRKRSRSWTAQMAGVSFGVIKVRLESGEEIDISLPRRDSKTGPGHRGFTVTPDARLSFREASRRRELTMNALAWDPETGEVLDAWNGMRDLREGILRHIDNAFTEDPLRVLRLAAFAARYGFPVAPETIQLARSIKDTYSELAVERVWGVWKKILLETQFPSHGLKILADTGWEEHYPQLANLHGVQQNPYYHQEGDAWVHTRMVVDEAANYARHLGLEGDDRLTLVLAALCHDMGKPSTTRVEMVDGNPAIICHGHDEAGVPVARSFMEAIDTPADVIKRVLPLVREHMVAFHTEGKPTKAAVQRLSRRLEPATLAEWSWLVKADSMGRISQGPRESPGDLWTDVAMEISALWQSPRPILMGRHLIAAGMKPGKEFGPLLQEALQAQDNQEFTDFLGASEWLANKLGLPDREDHDFPRGLLTEQELDERAEARFLEQFRGY